MPLNVFSSNWIEAVYIQEDIIRFYNRLSDYFFVLSRKIAHLSGLKQEPWNPGL